MDDVDWADFDFLDMGSGIGGSLVEAERLIGGRGIGIETNPSKVVEARAKGLAVVEGDMFSVPDSVRLRYVVLNNVLEHLPDLETVRAALSKASRVAEEFVYIRHPSFEDEAYLAELRLKQYWNDWHGHPSHILLSDFMRMFADMDLCGYVFQPVRKADDSEDPTILPVEAPRDQHEYEPTHGPKPYVEFDKPVYEAFDIVALTAPGRVELRYRSHPDESLAQPFVSVTSMGHRLAKAEWERDTAVQNLERLRARRAVKIALVASKAAGPAFSGWRALRKWGGSPPDTDT